MNKYFPILCAVILNFIFIPSSRAQSDEIVSIQSGILQQDVEFDIYFLASDELMGRDTGTQELKIASRYIATRFRQSGLKTPPGLDEFYQHVPLKQVKAPETVQLTLSDSTFQMTDHLISLGGFRGEITAPVIMLDYATREELANHDIDGKIVIATSGLPDMNLPRQLLSITEEKRQWVQNAGGAGLIERFVAGQSEWQMLNRYLTRDRLNLAPSNNFEDSPEMPHAWLNVMSKGMEKFLDGSTFETATITITGPETEHFRSRNVVGIIEGTDPELKDEYILLSAHYDHTGTLNDTTEADYIYNGARDNAVGTAGIIAAAGYLSENPPRRSVIVAAWTAEEKGLLGSGWYAGNPLIPLHQTIYNLNIDGAGYNDTSKVTVIGLGRTDADDELKRAARAFGLEAIPDPVPEQNLFNRSDNVHFARAGIPAPTYSMGITAFDDEINRYYHQVTDEPETLNYEYVTRYIRSFVMAAKTIADRDKAPFWMPGDEYEKSGVELYNRN